MNKQDTRYISFQALLKNLRKSQGVRQVELAARLSRPQSYVSKYESGERNIDFLELIDVIKALELDSSAVLQEFANKL